MSTMKDRYNKLHQLHGAYLEAEATLEAFIREIEREFGFEGDPNTLDEYFYFADKALSGAVEAEV